MPRGMAREDWAIMDIIPEYEHPPKGKDEVFDPDDFTFSGPPKITFLNLYKAKKTLGKYNYKVTIWVFGSSVEKS